MQFEARCLVLECFGFVQTENSHPPLRVWTPSEGCVNYSLFQNSFHQSSTSGRNHPIDMQRMSVFLPDSNNSFFYMQYHISISVSTIFHFLFSFPLLFRNLHSPRHILQFSYNVWFHFNKTRIRLLDFIAMHHIENNYYSVSTISRYCKYIIGRYWHPSS